MGRIPMLKVKSFLSKEQYNTLIDDLKFYTEATKKYDDNVADDLISSIENSVKLGRDRDTGDYAVISISVTEAGNLIDFLLEVYSSDSERLTPDYYRQLKEYRRKKRRNG